MTPQPESDVDLVAMLARLSARIHAGLRIADTLDSVAATVIDFLGFEVAAVNLRQPDGSYEIVSVAGSEEAAAQLLGTTVAKDVVFAELANSEEWGQLRFVPHERSRRDVTTLWIPTLEVSDDPKAWHPLDMLYAPLTAPGGELVGLLSVDVPTDGKRPDAIQRQLLEALAVHAGIAIATARANEQLHEEREQLRQEHKRLAASEAAFRFSFDGSATGMALVSLGATDIGCFQRANDAFGQIFGHAAADLTRHPIEALVNEADVLELHEALQDAAIGSVTNFRQQARFDRDDGSTGWVSLTATVIDPGDTESRFLMIHASDISEGRQREADLEYQAGHDPLTGLPNRRLLLNRLDEAVSRAHHYGHTASLLFCDLDGLKSINDQRGHLTGDAVLKETAGRLVEQVRSRDTVARFGGDEFVILAEDLRPEDAERLCARIIAAFEPSLDAIGTPVRLSIGRETITSASLDSQTVLQSADEAMYRSKGRALTDQV